MDNETIGGQTGSGTTYYVSLSREHNGRVKVSASAHYNAPAEEDPQDSTRKLTIAVATSLTVAAVAQASIEDVLQQVPETVVHAFIALVSETAGTFARQLGGEN